MKNSFLCRASIFLLTTLIFMSACSDAKKDQKSKIKQLMADPIKVTITNVDDLNVLFDKYQYNHENWENGNLEIPRITFSGIHKRWAKNSHKLPVQTKKSVFFHLMAPLALIANENIRYERNIVKTSPLDAMKLKKIAIKYRVIKDTTIHLTDAMRNTLLNRVDILPPSLTLAQAAEESGWATSRFAVQGNAFFGQWDFSGKGMKPLAHRKELGNYGVARFDSPLASVEAYMLNINRNKAYQKLRTVRAQLRAKKTAITGLKLAATLDKYSERGHSYIDGLRAIIRHNNLQPVDQAYLANNKLIHLLYN